MNNAERDQLDAFAAAAMQAMVTTPTGYTDDARLAQRAYEIASAMMAERARVHDAVHGESVSLWLDAIKRIAR